MHIRERCHAAHILPELDCIPELGVCHQDGVCFQDEQIVILLLLQHLEIAVVKLEPFLCPRAATNSGSLSYSLVRILCLLLACASMWGQLKQPMSQWVRSKQPVSMWVKSKQKLGMNALLLSRLMYAEQVEPILRSVF